MPAEKEKGEAMKLFFPRETFNDWEKGSGTLGSRPSAPRH